MVEAILLKPLDGRAIGSTHEFSDADFARLVERNAVKAAAPTQNKAALAPENKAAPVADNKAAKPQGRKRSKN